jgi:hypothetical protein
VYNRYLQNFYNSYNFTGYLKNIRICFRIGFNFLLGILLISSATIEIHEYPEKVRQFTHTIEFDYVEWTLDAIWQKMLQSAVSLEDYLPAKQPSEIIKKSMTTQAQITQLQAELSLLFSDPNIQNKTTAMAPVQQQLDQMMKNKSQLAPLVESSLQKQVGAILVENGFTVLGQPFPPVLYHSTPLPMALIVSPRDKIQQDANISLLSDMSAGDMAALEDRVMHDLDVSALVVPVGGVGVYPTMVMATSDLSYLVETIAHEWTHNFLTLRPLGINYDINAELRTINETTASIVGNEIGQQVIRRYYPELLPSEQPQEEKNEDSPKGTLVEQEAFNYRKEMHTTRVQVDEFLAAGKIDEAEKYMEVRRQFFWENGYPIRRLNQAYFAFYGAYADTPGGAAGKDPIGPQVRAFRSQSRSLSEFLEKISWITSFEQLKSMVTEQPAE